jgi:D-alanyl-D-alanine carboxypeptidase
VPDSAKADPAALVQLPQECTFEDYRIYAEQPACDAFVRMAEAARQDSVDLIADSGFRSPGFQRRIIKRRLEAGQPIDKILTQVAPPGYSEHHTGRAFDLVPSEARFAHGKAYRWLGANAGRFGFVESFPKGPPDSPAWEPWHWLYVGSNPRMDTTAQDDLNAN